MELTGKCKEEFEKWYNEVQKYNIGWFYRLQSEYQYGVLVDYFDSVGYLISIYKDYGGFHWCIGNMDEHSGSEEEGWGYYSEDRLEAITAAIEKAKELRNEFLNK